MAFLSFMNLFIYSDESGVFDKKHNDYFVFGGIICFGNDQKEKVCRRYKSVESQLRLAGHYKQDKELKACMVSKKTKWKLFKCLNKAYKFCVLIKQKQVLDDIFENKKHKQRFLDYVYKMCLRISLEYLIKNNLLNPYIIENIYVQADEHHTATDGLYELRENLLNEFKYGTFNSDWTSCREPLFPSMDSVIVKFCDSSKTLLVRAADIVANHFYHLALSMNGSIPPKDGCFIYEMPAKKILATGKSYFKNYAF